MNRFDKFIFDYFTDKYPKEMHKALDLWDKKLEREGKNVETKDKSIHKGH